MSGAHARSRGRPRLFDEEAVLDELTGLFWEKGYAQTSMADLVHASGVHKSSLYSTFGSKEELFSKIPPRLTLIFIPSGITLFRYSMAR